MQCQKFDSSLFTFNINKEAGNLLPSIPLMQNGTGFTELSTVFFIVFQS